jgi:hypothetical protein
MRVRIEGEGLCDILAFIVDVLCEIAILLG